MDLEQRLRASLVAPNPGAVFTARVMGRIGRGAAHRRGAFILISALLTLGAAAAILVWRMPTVQPEQVASAAVSVPESKSVFEPDPVVEAPVTQQSVPALAHKPEKIAVANDVPALQPAQQVLPTLIETPKASSSAPTHIFAAAQTPPPSHDNSVQQASRGEPAPAMPRLLPPSAVSGTPGPEDTRRSEESTGAAVLAARPNLESEFSEDTVLTVFMTEDGKIDRSYILGNPAQLMWGDMAFPIDFSAASTGMVPELLAKRWEPLGLRPEQLGQMGLAVFDNKNRPGTGNHWVLYAWPRRPGEPIGGFMPIHGQTWRSSFTYADAMAVVERNLPGALSDRGGASRGKPWLLLSPLGEVVGSGYAPAKSPRWARAAIMEANPGRRIGLVVGITDHVILGWLLPDQLNR